jgi:hypothetical protein
MGSMLMLSGCSTADRAPHHTVWLLRDSVSDNNGSGEQFMCSMLLSLLRNQHALSHRLCNATRAAPAYYAASTA